MGDSRDYFSIATDAELSVNYDRACKERDDLKYLLNSINKYLDPGTCDSVDGMVMIIKERDKLKAELVKLLGMLHTKNQELAAKSLALSCDECRRERDAARSALEDRDKMHQLAIQQSEASRLRLKAENERLKRIIAQELSENDELGCEYVYVTVLKEELAKAKQQELVHAVFAKDMETDKG